MNVKRYFAKTVREALRALKAELGADAIVLSNRAVEGGVEILALPPEAVSAVQTPKAPAAVTALAPKATSVAPRQVSAADDDDDFCVSLSPQAANPTSLSSAARDDTIPHGTPGISPFQSAWLGTAAAPGRSAGARDAIQFGCDDWPVFPSSLRKGVADARSDTTKQDVPGPRSAVIAPASGRLGKAEAAPAGDPRIESLQAANASLMAELTGIRNMIERQLAGFAWGDARRNAPGRAEVIGELLEAGFSGRLARKLGEAVGDEACLKEARDAVRNALARDLRARSTDADLIDQGGVFALVGPTGVGKTTTTAKIAARCVLRHGAEKVALITTDGYRIGAQEQLRIYGRILGVPVFPVRDASDLRQTLAELEGKHIVLIDTVGMSQRDRMVAHQAAMLMGAGKVRRLLLLNATCRGDTLDDVIEAYRGPDLAGCIFTKVDEAASLAPALGAAISHELDVFYVTNGQRVPEDLHLPNRSYLLHRAMRAPAEQSPWTLQGDEAALMMAAGGVGN